MHTTLGFLEDLAQNNHREWFTENKASYEQAKKEFQMLVKTLIQEIGLFDADIAPLEVKHCVFRINRDIRFSKNKSPYKDNFGASLQKGGKKANTAGYYVHIQPQASFIGGGIYMPPSADLAKIRQEIDYNAEEFRELLNAEDFQKLFGKLHGDALRTAPKGYQRDNPNIDLLRMKSFVVIQPCTDALVKGENFKKTILDAALAMKPVIDFLNRALE